MRLAANGFLLFLACHRVVSSMPASQVEFADVHSTQSLLADGTIRLACNIVVTQ